MGKNISPRTCCRGAVLRAAKLSSPTMTNTNWTGSRCANWVSATSLTMIASGICYVNGGRPNVFPFSFALRIPALDSLIWCRTVVAKPRQVEIFHRSPFPRVCARFNFHSLLRATNTAIHQVALEESPPAGSTAANLYKEGQVLVTVNRTWKRGNIGVPSIGRYLL